MLGRSSSRSLFSARRICIIHNHRNSRLLHSSFVFNGKSLRPFLLADIGEGITECEVLKWAIKPNAKVDTFDPLCEVQSDKASVEITSPYPGIVKELLVQEGEIAKVGHGLCVIEVDDEATGGETSNSPTTGGATETVEEAPSADKAPAPAPEATKPSQASEEPLAQPRRHHPLDPSKPPSPPSQPPSSSSTQFAPAKNTISAPSVRHFARKNGIEDLSVVNGSGKNGRIEKADVERYLTKGTEAPGAGTATKPARSEEVQTLEIGRTRWAMYKAMEKSLEVPHFGYSTTLDLTELHALLPLLNASIPSTFNPPPPPKHAPLVSPSAILPPSSNSPPSPPPEASLRHYKKLTFLPFLLKTLSRAMLEWPVFRTTISHPPPSSSSPTSKPTLALRPHADISLALSTPTGLYSPTIQAVDKLSTYEVAGEIKRLAELGRRIPSALTKSDMPSSGGTITVSNIGAIGKGDFASPILVPGGGVAIVAIGRAKWVMREGDEPGQAQHRLEVGISWCADHRVVEGAEMAAFTETWRSWIEKPQRLIPEAQ